MSASNYPPGVSGNEPQIAGEEECPKCGFPVSVHPMDEVDANDGADGSYTVWGECPQECHNCGGDGGFQGAGDNMDVWQCPACNGTGVEPKS